MAANRDTAEAYKYNTPVQEFRTIGGKTFEEIGISPKELNYPVFGLVDFLHSNGVDKAKEMYRAKRFDVVCQTFDLFLYATLVLYLSCKGIKKALQGVCRAFAIYAHGRIICMGFS